MPETACLHAHHQSASDGRTRSRRVVVVTASLTPRVVTASTTVSAALRPPCLRVSVVADATQFGRSVSISSRCRRPSASGFRTVGHRLHTCAFVRVTARIRANADARIRLITRDTCALRPPVDGASRSLTTTPSAGSQTAHHPLGWLPDALRHQLSRVTSISHSRITPPSCVALIRSEYLAARVSSLHTVGPE